MPDLSRFRALSVHEQAIVALGVLLDGHDAVDFLKSDKDRKLALTRAAADLAELPPDLRVPLLGTMLRQALQHLEEIPSNE